MCPTFWTAILLLSDWVFFLPEYLLHSCTSVVCMFKYHVHIMTWRSVVCAIETDSIIKAIYGLVKCGRFHKIRIHIITVIQCMTCHHHLCFFEGVFFFHVYNYFYRYQWRIDWLQNYYKKILEIFITKRNKTVLVHLIRMTTKKSTTFLDFLCHRYENTSWYGQWNVYNRMSINIKEKSIHCIFLLQLECITKMSSAIVFIQTLFDRIGFMRWNQICLLFLCEISKDTISQIYFDNELS